MRVWHALWLQRIDAKIQALQQLQAEEAHGHRSRPRPPEWIVELGLGVGRPPVQVHGGDCHMAGKRRRPVDRDEARRLLAAGLHACTHCQPAAVLGILDLSRPPGPALSTRRGALTERLYRPVPMLRPRRYAHRQEQDPRR
ncbi:DUF6233 domain-containing protein [Streptomyces sp. NPDC059766]|uniref:DUF6233 domain-containing protein n=1 Tax=Streptomyces sp. NPDC059766 TaxID=3346940 RepID=UPI00364EA813